MTDTRSTTAPNLEENASHGSGAFIWYELMTPDADAAKAFYDAVVGWEIGPAVAEFNGYRMIGRSDGGFAGGVLPITPEMQQHGAKPGWLGYISVANVDDAVTAIEEAGGRTWMAAVDIPNVGRVALVTDVQAAPFYVMTPIARADDPNATSDVFSPDREQRVGWNELQTSDVEAARGFYRDQFGWKSEEFMPMGEMGEYRFFSHGDTRLGAVFNPGHGQPAQWRFYFRVPSIAAAKRVAEEKGATIQMGPIEVPTGDYIIIASDPQGAQFALVGRE